MQRHGSKEDPEREARASVWLGGCDCFWHLDAGSLGTFEGDAIGSSRLSGGGWLVQMGSDEHDVMVTAYLLNPEEHDGEIFFPPGGGGYRSGSGECLFPAPPLGRLCEVFEPHPADFVMREATYQAIAGRMFGDAFRRVAPGRIDTQRFELNFRLTAEESFLHSLVPGMLLCGDGDDD